MAERPEPIVIDVSDSEPDHYLWPDDGASSTTPLSGTVVKVETPDVIASVATGDIVKVEICKFSSNVGVVT